MINTQDEEFLELAKDILNDDKFKLLKQDRHHGSNKYDHCKRVSYVSYKIAKFFNTDYKGIVRPALLHDFFYGERTEKPENSYLEHPKTSAANAKYYYNINEKEESIIKTHMFHHLVLRKIFPFINIHENAKLKESAPKSKEAWIVCFSDLVVSIAEAGKYKVNYSVYLMALFLINIITMNK